MSDDNLALNLACACSVLPSIAEVCRRVGINRQQFNKYLAGSVHPSRYNMRRICDFFGVTEAELLMEPSRFAELVSLRRRPGLSEKADILGPTFRRLCNASAPLDRYCGAYFRYFYSYSHPGLIVRSLAVLGHRDGHYLWKNIERGPPGAHGARVVSRYEGIAFLLGERITVVENECVLSSSITQMTLYPSYHTGVDYLLGIQTGGPLKRGRKPAASRVLLDYLGQNVDFRRALAQCGMFDPSELEPWVVTLVNNRMPPDASVFDVEQL
ncbi:helix-turn-helix domain-containing protein [Kushneria aurantia]|uniref:Helix-turn-helix domain-containing protein n=1 Tax=Kushneria aurantia TaxID=504092 RepID=A0ABV6G315_9GAMM|nr:helix-turn-helix transcriptional regulator [Kushneria aurantia]